LDGKGRVLAGTSVPPRNPATQFLPWAAQPNDYEVPVSPVGNGLIVRAQAYRTGLGVIGSGLFWLVGALSAMTAWMLIANWRHTTQGGFPVRGKRKDGSLFDARLYVSPLVDARGNQTGWMTSMTDITEPNRIREQLQASHERFTTVLEALDASVSVAPLGSEELLFPNKLHRLWFG